MRTMPLSIGTIHFVGIGGIGMSGIAEILHNLGHKVQGSDVAENYNVERLRKKGIAIRIGHHEDHLGDSRVVVISSAVKADNPEVVAARARLVPVVRRAEMLAELMRLKNAIAIGGTHGKTTTTSMVAALLDAANLDPTVINGGIINAYGTNARLGAGEWMVVEADESDGSFTKLPATAVVVTNIDPEHMDHYGSFDRLQEAFRTFVENTPFYGFAAMCLDHPEVQAMIARIPDRKIVTYGFNPQALVRGINLRPDPLGTTFDVVVTDRVTRESRTLTDLRLPMCGEHNVLNSLAVVVVALALELDDAVIRKALAGFSGVKRRFTRTGETDGIAVIDDYGHHPVEIAAVLKAARAACPKGRVIAVVQPHRYSRLQGLFQEFCKAFNDADTVLVADVYAAGEAPIAGADRDSLVRGIREHGHRSVEALPDPKALPEVINRLAQSGDMVVCLGAGNVTTWAQSLPQDLARFRANVGGGSHG